MRLRLVIALFGTLLFLACKEQKKKKIFSKQETSCEVQLTETYVCPSECERGMTYYLEGKCDICHHNLVKKEK